MLTPLFLVLAQAPTRPQPKTPTRQIAAEQQALGALTPAEPPTELNALTPLVGRWKCEGETPSVETHEGPEPAKSSPALRLRASVNVQRELTGHWLRLELRGSVLGEKRGWTETGHLGFAGDRFVLFTVDSLGGDARATGTGWSMGQWTWDGEAVVRGATLPFRLTMTRPDDGTFALTRALQVNGHWQTISTIRCRR